jgi:DNA invertase Pin-like site-specific DNA recombinase
MKRVGSEATIRAEPSTAPAARAVAYVRVSLEREDMISPELQMKAVSEYCALRNYGIVRVVEDLDLSGRFWKTRQVDEAVAMLERGDAEVLVVWRWSRVSRNRLDWAMALDRVEAAGGRLESASEGFDTTTATGRFARGMLAEFAAFESDRLADIWREVRDRRISLGLPPWGHRQFGYVQRHGAYVIDKKTSYSSRGSSAHMATAVANKASLNCQHVTSSANHVLAGNEKVNSSDPFVPPVRPTRSARRNGLAVTGRDA